MIVNYDDDYYDDLEPLPSPRDTRGDIIRQIEELIASIKKRLKYSYDSEKERKEDEGLLKQLEQNLEEERWFYSRGM